MLGIRRSGFCTAREEVIFGSIGGSVQFAEVAFFVVFVAVSCKGRLGDGYILWQIDGKLYALTVLDGTVLGSSLILAALHAATVVERPWRWIT